MSRIDQAWRRAGRQVDDVPPVDFSIESFPAETYAAAPVSGSPGEPRGAIPRAVPHGLAGPRLATAVTVSNVTEPVGHATHGVQLHTPAVRPAFDTTPGVLDAAPGVVAQCARLVDALHARARDRALNIVVLTTPGSNVHLAHASIHIARLLAADGSAVMLIDAGTNEPRASTLLGVDPRAVIDIAVIEVPPVQLAILNIQHHALAARLRTVAEQSGARWIVVQAPAVADVPARTGLHAVVRAGDAVILVVPASTPTPAIAEAVGAVGRERLVGTVLVGVDV